MAGALLHTDFRVANTGKTALQRSPFSLPCLLPLMKSHPPSHAQAWTERELLRTHPHELSGRIADSRGRLKQELTCPLACQGRVKSRFMPKRKLKTMPQNKRGEALPKFTKSSQARTRLKHKIAYNFRLYISLHTIKNNARTRVRECSNEMRRE